jgi:hypothetical protein
MQALPIKCLHNIDEVWLPRYDDPKSRAVCIPAARACRPLHPRICSEKGAFHLEMREEPCMIAVLLVNYAGSLSRPGVGRFLRDRSFSDQRDVPLMDYCPGHLMNRTTEILIRGRGGVIIFVPDARAISSRPMALYLESHRDSNCQAIHFTQEKHSKHFN